jgi:alpha-tubulin suppressor-like RCC1 family protein
VLSGNTTTVGTYHFAVRATNGIAPAATTPTLTVAVAKPSAGSVLSWGEDSSAQLGPGYRPSSLVPAPVTFPAGTSIVQVATGINHGLALTSAGKVYAWGNNICGQLGNGTDGSCGNDIPVRTPALVPFPSGTPAIVAVAAGANHSLALTADGNVWGWGNNGLGELGVGTDSETRDAPVKTNLGSYAGKVVAIAGDGYSSVALTADGNVLTWGDNGRGALGRGSFTPDHVNTPGLVQLGPYAGTIVSIAAGGPQAGHVVALTRAGKVIAWGNNEQGQVGDATKTNRPAPVAVVAPAGLSAMPPIAAIGAGSYHSFARAKNGAVYGWGDNGYGELGDGNVSVEDPTPVAVAPPTGSATLPSLADIVGGDFHSAALTTGGVLYGTGNNGSGQIGDGTTDNHAYLAKTLLPPGTTVASVSTTTDFDLALVGKPGPFVARLTPRSGTVAGGAKEVIVGRGFAPGATVSFGGTAGTGVTVLSSTEIEVTAPAHAAGTVDVRVTTSAGTSPVFVGDRYTYG